MRHDPRELSLPRDNSLDLVITPTPYEFTNVAVRGSQGLSDHVLVVCHLSVRRYKTPPIRYPYRNIRQIDAAESECRLWSFQRFTEAAD